MTWQTSSPIILWISPEKSSLHRLYVDESVNRRDLAITFCACILSSCERRKFHYIAIHIYYNTTHWRALVGESGSAALSTTTTTVAFNIHCTIQTASDTISRVQQFASSDRKIFLKDFPEYTEFYVADSMVRFDIILYFIFFFLSVTCFFFYSWDELLFVMIILLTLFFLWSFIMVDEYSLHFCFKNKSLSEATIFNFFLVSLFFIQYKCSMWSTFTLNSFSFYHILSYIFKEKSCSYSIIILNLLTHLIDLFFSHLGKKEFPEINNINAEKVRKT